MYFSWKFRLRFARHRQAPKRWQKRHRKFRHKNNGSEYWTNLNLKRNWIQTKILCAERSEFIFYWTKKNADENFQKLWLNGIFNDNFWQPFRQLQLDFDKKLLNRILPDKMRSETCATEKILKNGGLTSSKLTNRLWKICSTEYWKKIEFYRKNKRKNAE